MILKKTEPAVPWIKRQTLFNETAPCTSFQLPICHFFRSFGGGGGRKKVFETPAVVFAVFPFPFGGEDGTMGGGKKEEEEYRSRTELCEEEAEIET